MFFTEVLRFGEDVNPSNKVLNCFALRCQCCDNGGAHLS